VAVWACPAVAGEWPGWRGLEREGRAEPGNYPTQWSAEKCIRWKTPIRGKGHSSPIVVGDSVLVASAYAAAEGEALRVVRLCIWWGISAVVLAWSVPFAFAAFLRRPGPTIRQVAGAALCCVAAGAFARCATAAFFDFGAGEPSTDARMESWLLTANMVSLSLILSSFALAARDKMRLGLVFVALVFSSFVILGRPMPEYFDLRTPGRYGSATLHAAAIPLGIAAGLLLLVLLEGQSKPQTQQRQGRAGSLQIILGIMVVAGTVTGGVMLARMLPPATIVTICGVAWFVLSLLGCGLPSIYPRGRWLAALLVLAGALGFSTRNYLGVSKELARAVICLDRETGAVKWTREGLHGPQPPMSYRNSPATPTPVSDGERAIAWFGSAGAMCTDLSGKMLWTSRDVPFDDVHGVGASPLLCDGLLVIPGTQPDAPYVAALDAATGRRVWTAGLRPWPGGEGQARTPAVATVEGRKLLLVWAWDGVGKEDLLRALDIKSGQEVWRHPVATHSEQVASAVSDGDTVFLATARRVQALSLSKLGGGQEPTVWATELRCRGQLVASPVLSNGLLFVVSAHRDAHCLDARTGELLWSRQLNGRGCMASPIAAGGAVYFPDVSGKTTVVAAERAFRKLTENELGEAIWASPAPVAGRLYVRTTGHLWCIEEKP